MNVEIRQIPSQRYWGVQVKPPPASVVEAVPGALAAIYGSIASAGYEPVGPPFLTDVQLVGADISFEVGVLCDDAPIATDGIHGGELPACLAAVHLHRGAYDELEAIYGELESWVRAPWLPPGWGHSRGVSDRPGRSARIYDRGGLSHS